MALWLLKTEPDEYSFDELVSDALARWDGVSNALALKHLRQMAKGDSVLIYHTGKERAVVGIARVVSDPYADPATDDPRRVVVDVQPVRKLKNPVTLDQIKSDPAFEGWELIRIARLSVMPVSPAMWKRIESLGT